jgi:hypothetical protein
MISFGFLLISLILLFYILETSSTKMDIWDYFSSCKDISEGVILNSDWFLFIDFYFAAYFVPFPIFDSPV